MVIRLSNWQPVSQSVIVVSALPHVIGEAERHFEGVRAVVVCAGGKVAQLVYEHAR
jgi:hypothetical protein